MSFGQRTLFLGLGLTAGSVCLAEAGSDPVVELPPYVVVATRTPLDPDRVSPSVSVIDAEAIGRWQSRSVIDVLSRQSGAVVTTSGGTGAQASLFTRGTNSDQTAFFFEDRRINPGFSNQFDLESLPVAGLRAIEFQRGASSVNYGSSGIGGVVALRAGSPLADGAGTDLDLEGEFGSHYYKRGAVSARVAGERAGVIVGGSVIDTDNERPNDAYESGTGSLRFDFRLAEHLLFETVGVFSRAQKELPGDVVNPFPEGAEQDTTNWLLSPGLVFTNETLRAHLFYARSRSDLDVNALATGRFDTESRVDADEFNLQVDLEAAETLLLSAGSVYRRDDASRSDVAFFGPPVPYAQVFDQTGFWGRALWQVFEPLELRAGLRYDDYSEFGDATTGDLEALLTIEPAALVLFAKVATSYAPPSAADVAFDSDPVTTPLRPEEGLAYELGLRQELFDGRAGWSAVAFYNDITDLLDFDPLTFDTLNLSEATLQGVEVAAEASPFESLTLTASYTYLDAREKGGARLLRRPRHLVQAGLYHRPLKTLGLGLEATGNVDRLDLDPATFAVIDGDDFVVLGLVADWRIQEQFSVFGRIDNLTDLEYATVAGFPALGRTAYLGLRANF